MSDTAAEEIAKTMEMRGEKKSPWDKTVLFSETGSSGSSAEWETPGWLFHRLDNEFSFDLDASATEHNAKCRNFFSMEDDALSLRWAEHGSSIWLNPPYGRGVGKWVEKAYKESLYGAIVVVLIFARTDTRWWHDWAMKAAEVRFIKGRVRFIRDDGATGPATAPSAVLVFDESRRVPVITWESTE